MLDWLKGREKEVKDTKVKSEDFRILKPIKTGFQHTKSWLIADFSMIKRIRHL